MVQEKKCFALISESNIPLCRGLTATRQFQYVFFQIGFWLSLRLIEKQVDSYHDNFFKSSSNLFINVNVLLTEILQGPRGWKIQNLVELDDSIQNYQSVFYC